MTIAAALLLGGFVMFLGFGLFILTQPRRASLLEERLGNEPVIEEIALPEDGSLDVIQMNKPLTERFLSPAFSALGNAMLSRLPLKDVEALRALIAEAGRPKGKSPEVVMAQQGIFFLVGVLAGLLLVNVAGFAAPLSYGVPIMSGLFGLTSPRTQLKRAGKKRRAAIVKVLPDMVDLLTVSVEAGLTFEAALRRVCDKFDNELSTEFQQALNEYRLGLPLSTALKEMADRLGVQQVQVIIRVVLQSEQLGTSLGSILRIQSEQLRRERRARAQELGQKAPVKMLLPMVGCIFPTIFIVLLGPAVVHIITGNSAH